MEKMSPKEILDEMKSLEHHDLVGMYGESHKIVENALRECIKATTHNAVKTQKLDVIHPQVETLDIELNY